MIPPRLFRFLVPLILLLSFALTGFAQTTIVHGVITDAVKQSPLSYISVLFPGSTIGTNTDDGGHFELRTDDAGYNKIRISAIGYKTVDQAIIPGKEQTINIRLNADNHSLSEVIVKPKKHHYRNKDNPAVELIDLVVAHKAQNRVTHYDYAQYDEYEKMTVAFNNTPEKLRKNLLFRHFKFMTDNLDTTTIPGRALLPWYMKEVSEDVYYRHSPQKKKTIVTGDKQVDFGEFVDNNGLNAYLKHLYQDVDIYQNNIYIVTNQFLSPIADMAPTFYRYYITDTVQNGNEKWVELSFFPRNKADFLFQGKIYVTLDGRYAVPKADMHINQDINLNWVKDLHVVLDFDRAADSTYELRRSTLTADFSILQNSKGSMWGSREVTYKNYRFNQPAPDSMYSGPAVVETADASAKQDAFWAANRLDTLTEAEERTYKNIDSLKNNKTFKHIADAATLVLAGYKQASPYFEVGPVNTFYSFNPVEGLRLRLGGRTKPALSKRFYLETYAAYGFKDEKWKYYLGGIYSFTGRSIYEFPQTLLKLDYQHDTKIPGQDLQFVQEDNFLLSFKRGVNDQFLYNDIYKAEFIKEYRNHFSYDLSFRNWTQTPAGSLVYTTTEGGMQATVPNITTSEAGLTLRWAPHEEFYQGKLYRTPILNKYPVFTLRTAIGLKDVLGGDYNYQSVTLNVYKHFFLSQLGYTDVVAEGGYIFGRAPYPLLDIHHANQSYGFQLQSYNLMNFLEFVSDHYASIFVDHCFNGFFLNKMPVIKKLHWREYVDVKSLWGGIRNENLPAKNTDLLQFPTAANGAATTFALGSTPYVEGSVGIGNIFNFFRVDYVRRFTYLDHPNVSASGIRFFAKFDF